MVTLDDRQLLREADSWRSAGLFQTRNPAIVISPASTLSAIRVFRSARSQGACPRFRSCFKEWPNSTPPASPGRDPGGHGVYAAPSVNSFGGVPSPGMYPPQTIR